MRKLLALLLSTLSLASQARHLPLAISDGSTTLDDVKKITVNSSLLTGTNNGAILNLNITGATLSGVTGLATAGSVFFADSTGKLGQNNSRLYWDNNNAYLGIGTSVPISKLHVASGNAQFENNYGLYWGNLGSGGGDTSRIYSTFTGSENQSLVLQTTNDPDDHIILLPSGNVGINDTTPDYSLDVNGSLGVAGATTFTGHVTHSGSASNIILGSNYLSADGDDEGVYVNSDGNVGIGTSTADSRLKVRMITAANSVAVGILNANNSNNMISLGSGTDQFAGKITLAASGSTRAFISADTNTSAYFSGNVGIGNNSPGKLLDIYGGTIRSIYDGASFTENFISSNSHYSGAGGYRLYGYSGVSGSTGGGLLWSNPGYSLGSALALWSYESVPIVFGTNNTERMRVSSAGNVGIGTTTPTAALDVVGAIKASTNISAASFSGSGAGLTGLDANQISTGTLAAARLPVINSALIVNDLADIDIASNAAIAGSKINPNFGAQNLSTTGYISVGTTSSTSPLTINSSLGAPASSKSLNIISTMSGDAPATNAVHYGIYNSESISFSGGGSFSSIYGIYTGFSGTGVVDNWYANYVAVPTGVSTNNKYAFVSENGAGHVGIGTTAPSAPLTIATSQSSNSKTIVLDSLISQVSPAPSDVHYGIYNLERANFSGGSAVLSNAYSSYTGINVIGGSITNWYGNYIAAPIGNITNKYALVTEANAGNVGIGTSSPGQKLSVAGTLGVTGAATFASTVTIGGNTAWHLGNDGASSGLDADLLDGLSSASFYLASNPSAYITDGNTGWDNSYGFITDGNTNWDNSYGFWNAANDGAGSGLDADTVDGLSSASFYLASNPAGYINDGNTNWNNSYGFITDGNTGWDNSYGFITDGNTNWDNSYGFWNAANDGAGTGLDADVLDGISSASFMRSDTSSDFQGGGGAVTTYAMVAGRTINTAGGGLSALQVFQPTPNADAFMTFHISGDYAAYFGIDGSTNDLSYGGWSAGGVKHRVWHAGNDGANSGLDADTLDGLSSGSFATASGGNAYGTWGINITGSSGYAGNSGYAQSIADNSVNSSKIIDGSIYREDIANNAINNDKIESLDGNKIYGKNSLDASMLKGQIATNSSQVGIQASQNIILDSPMVNVMHRIDVGEGAHRYDNSATWDVYSDIRLKDVQGSYEYGLEEISRLNPIRYKYKKDNPIGMSSDHNMSGFSAQEVQEVIPDAVHVRDNGYLQLNFDPIHLAVINAVKELKVKNDTLAEELNSEKAKNESQEATIAALKELVCKDHPESDVCSN